MIKPTTIAINIIVILMITLLFFLILSLIIFQFYNLDLSSAWSFTGSIFGGVSTLAAAYIASLLFNDWRDVQSATNKSDHAIKTLKSLMQIQSALDYYAYETRRFCLYYNKYEESREEEFNEIKLASNNLYTKLIAEYILNASYCSNIYKINIPVPDYDAIDDFSSYLYTINGAFSYIKNRDSNIKKGINDGVSVTTYLTEIQKRKHNFQKEVVDKVSNILARDIKLN